MTNSTNLTNANTNLTTEVNTMTNSTNLTNANTNLTTEAAPMRNLLAESIKVTLPTGTTSRTLENVIIDLEMYEAEQECEVVTTAFTYEDMNGPCEACLYGLSEEMGCHCNDHGGVTSIQVFSLVTDGRLIMSLALKDDQVCAMEDYLKGYTKTESFSCYDSETTNDQLTNEVIPMDDINKSQLVSTMAAELFHNGLKPVDALRVSASFVGAIEYMEDMEDFTEALLDGLNITTVEIKDNDKPEFCNEGITEALIAANYLAEDGSMGTRLHEIAALRTEAYAPNLASEGITRRFGYAPVAYSDLFVEATHALESSEYTVDSEMLSIALQVQAELGADEDDEGYVIKGCQKMDSNEAYVSEFKGDRRGRLYQAACHGPNGQASDRSRALMNLAGVPMDYDVKAVRKVIMAEIADMADDVKAAAIELRELGDVQFILAHDQGKKVKTNVSKPWSFVKAAKIMRELKAGNRPYIGMAVGLDAKCSGPQLGALMVGDQKIAAACGMTLVELEDAYHIAIASIEKAGFTNLSRGGIKKSYMGIFYGQGWAAFTNIKALLEEGQDELVNCLYPDGIVKDDVAKAFHRAVTSSFGSKMVAVRNMFKEYAKVTTGRTKHYMADGFQVAMNYKEKVNVLGEAMEYDTATPDVFIQNNTEQHKFINFQLKTKAVHVGDFARNGFVNMIQATDALIARLIIVHLKRLGARHIVAVHDCFRVNVTEMHLLEQAIKNAYMDLFGSRTNCKTKDLPMGTDILALYFQGANKQLVEGATPKMASQFFSSGKRRMTKVNGEQVADLIQALGTSYYFAK